jgi:D-psicose/D-tagatose/L-ribulose 3-epimerase
MRVSISNLAWEKEDDAAVLRILNRYHVDAIDIAPGKYFPDFASASSEQINAVRGWWADRGIEIIGMQSLLFGTSGLNLFAGPEIQERMLNHLAEVCRIGEGLNARLIVFGSPRNRDRTGLSDEQSLEMAISFFTRLGGIAEHHGVTICLEPNPECYGSNFMTTSAEAAAVVMEVNHPAIKMQFDTGSLSINGEDPFKICSDYQHLIGHVHVSEPQLLPVGTGATDHPSASAALRQFMPDAPVTIEMLTRSVEDALDAVASSVQVVTSLYGSSCAVMD